MQASLRRQASTASSLQFRPTIFPAEDPTNAATEVRTISSFNAGQNAGSPFPWFECHESDSVQSTYGGSIAEIRERPSFRHFFQARTFVLKRTSFFKFAVLSLLSRPAHERRIYRTIRDNTVATIVEIGVQNGTGSQRLIEAALRFSSPEEIRYTGIDLFEARAVQASGMKLKDAHRTLKQQGVAVQLVPGDPFSALARSANTLTGTDLIIIRADQDPEALQRAWFYVPRMLHERSVVLRESTSAKNRQFEVLSHDTIEQWASENAVVRRAA